MRYKITFAYKGTAYAGWQRQKNAVSVQEVLEGAFERLFGAPCSVTASGRTDAGVHAAGQVAHFDADTSVPPDKIPFAVNAFLPQDISVYACEPVSDAFNARFTAKRKTYAYSFYTEPHINPLKNDLACHIPYTLNLPEMRRAAEFLKGTHDFKCFEATGSIIKNTVRTLYFLEISYDNGEYKITVTGNGFLYNMVRIIAGTLVYVGMGKIPADDISGIIEGRDRTRAGKTLPANGLTLVSVEY
ncbi:MAG: tRNA pseudouridine(38-40) synthase TruA [Clostridiaceae bacterium]|jgi:tRNA pseudouridine38-40 synthase|nr:tRNA pseudouridine(38-40) synthase TruA [Clostridiaceae bacterium]